MVLICKRAVKLGFPRASSVLGQCFGFFLCDLGALFLFNLSEAGLFLGFFAQ